MKEEKGSRTSVGVSILRAVHQLMDKGPKIFVDDVILKLLHPDVTHYIRENEERYNTLRARRLRSHVLLRSRYAEDCLAEAFRRGTRQYVILGAGLDTFAYRQPEWASELKIFELDHPVSQREKANRLSRAGITLPENLTFIPVNLEKQLLSDVLTDASFRFDQPVFISWLGVMAYLRPETNAKIFQFIVSLPADSELVLTFAHKSRRQRPHSLASRAEILNEPWLTRTTAGELSKKMASLGFSYVSFLKPKEAKKRYYNDRESNLPPPRRESIVHLVV